VEIREEYVEDGDGSDEEESESGMFSSFTFQNFRYI
jgi:hypothetical protein